MKTEDFNYNLPSRLIAQTPIINRSDSKLLVLDKKTKEINHTKFSDIVSYFKEGDVLVLNDSKVIPARLFGEKTETLAKVELLLLKEKEKDVWESLVKPAKRIKKGTKVNFSNKLMAECIEEKEEGIRIFKFTYEGNFYEILDDLGDMPLPPYIKEKLNDKDRYQTVYAKNLGSAAAPTAGLHFTKEVLEKIKTKGVKVVYITLHVGLGTFRPVQVDDVKNHKMHSEYYSVNKEVSEVLNNAKRIIAVGTTTTRTLETIRRDKEKFEECSGWTDIFIYPGFKFKAVDGLITNFHLPKSTLLMLVSAFASKELILKAYNEAIENEYRFFSFGDSMFIK